MPGIHVRAASQLDWIEQEKGSVLTVPGSYWLCHKKNVYKFIFRYHRTVKNVKEFEYVRELMKIIRRILKCQPNQGQQFGTHHLLVTYHHISWTRQDKMFAMLKFHERSNAAAFSRAFVLTIRITNCSEGVTFVRQRGSKSNKQDHSEILQDEDSDSVSSHSNGYETFQTEQVSSTIALPSTQLKKRGNPNNIDATRKSTSHVSTILLSQDNSCETDKNDSIKRSRNTTLSVENIAASQTEIHEQTSANSKTLQQLQLENMVCLEEGLTPLLAQDACGFAGCNTPDSKKCDNEMRRSVNYQQSQNVSAKDDTSSDSTNLPFQYLIEKDIENTKCNIESDVRLQKISKLDNISSQSSTEDEEYSEAQCRYKNQETHKQSTKDSETSSIEHTKLIEKLTNVSTKFDANDCHLPEDNKESEGKTVPSNSTLRSSNITDLVMEGLMFTIRQDQDSVKVVEQKTKLEVDEVLENSERAETKEGGKRLVNSSLLRLENLVTMIELSTVEKHPDATEKALNVDKLVDLNSFQNKYSLTNHVGNEKTIGINYETKHKERQEPFLELHDNSDSHTFVATPERTFSTNKTSIIPLSQECKYGTQFGKTVEDMIEIEMDDEEEEEEDIIPEALQCRAFQTAKVSKEDVDMTSAFELKDGSSQQDLLMDDTETENKTMYKSNVAAIQRDHTKLSNINHDYKKYPTDENTGRNKRSSNVPRIISNEVITVDQMPLALRNAIKNKLLRGRTNIDRKTNFDQNDTPHNSNCSLPNSETILSKKGVENSTLNTRESENGLKTLTAELLNNETNEAENKSSVTHNVGQGNKSTVISNKDTNTKLVIKKSELPKCESSSRRTKQNASSKLEDITEDFYKDLLHQQRKDIDHRKSLRRRKKPSSISKEPKNSEIRIEMLKFVHDITRGAKVVLERLSTKDIARKLEKSSSLTTCIT